ncbi:MAG: RtcB family protein [Candidatus Eisenbacteria bacterium]|nr:RtcB family protein [Candidatus Eisenbacteria bacterium]
MTKGETIEIREIRDWLFEIPRSGGMRVPGRIYADREMMSSIRGEGAVEQVRNVAHLPGIVGFSLAMPDIHWGYGFPIGGVAATDISQGGVISPGGVGYDINCGVRLCTTRLRASDVRPRIRRVVQRLFANIPCGVGSEGAIQRVSMQELDRVMVEGAAWAIAQGYGQPGQLEQIEDRGRMRPADPSKVSARARERGAEQIGTLGSGNHFAEIDVVDRICDPEAAREFGIEEGTIAVLIHTGSRGFGYQICDDYLKLLGRSMSKYDIHVPDRQLACAPVDSDEGKAYLAAMACAANFAWANRQTIQHLAERSLIEAMETSPAEVGLRLLYDVCHNIAKIEEHEVEGRLRTVCVHRKGATRAHPPRGQRLPWKAGQPVIVPGDMGTESWVCAGTERSLEETLGSSCHGAGRILSRSAAKARFGGRDLVADLEREGITVQAKARGTLAEEMRGAYKDVGRVVDVMERAGVSRKVARLRPIGVIKG